MQINPGALRLPGLQQAANNTVFRRRHVHPRQHPQPAQDLPARPREGRRAARHRPRHRQGRLRRADGPVRLRQDHPAQPDRRTGFAELGQHRGRRRPHRQPRLRPAGAVAQQPCRLRVPVLQPDADPQRAEECRTAAAADPPLRRRPQAQCGDRAGTGGAKGSRRASPERTLRRPAAARGDRPRDRLRPDPADLRRTHRRPGPAVGGRHPWAAPRPSLVAINGPRCARTGAAPGCRAHWPRRAPPSASSGRSAPPRSPPTRCRGSGPGRRSGRRGSCRSAPCC